MYLLVLVFGVHLGRVEPAWPMDRGTQGMTVLCELASDFHKVLSPKTNGPERSHRSLISSLFTTGLANQAERTLCISLWHSVLRKKSVIISGIFITYWLGGG